MSAYVDPRPRKTDQRRLHIKRTPEGLAAHVAVQPNGCWNWTHWTGPRGYGRWGKSLAHRVAYELLVGPIPAGLDLDHLCRNTGCVNPEHLEPVTRAENARRIPKKTHCKNGHEFTPETARPRSDGKGRDCKPCHNDRQNRRRRAASAALRQERAA